MDYFSVLAIKNQQKQELIKKNYRKIYEHEMAHKNAAGSLAGSVVIEKDSQGIPIGGHVSIKMPKLDKLHPEKTIKQAEIVFKAALAPAEPSDQDYKVANEAKKIKYQAENIQKKKRLDYYA